MFIYKRKYSLVVPKILIAPFAREQFLIITVIMDLSVTIWQLTPISFYDNARQKDWSILCFLCGTSQQWWLVKCQWLCRLLWSHWLPFLHKFSNLCIFMLSSFFFICFK